MFELKTGQLNLNLLAEHVVDIYILFVYFCSLPVGNSVVTSVETRSGYCF